MSEEVVFYHNPQSRAVMTRWMLEEVGAPYRIVHIDFAREEHKAPDFLKINPMGKIPAIVHRGVVVTETAAIIGYLADAFPAAGLAPAIDEPARGTYLRWLVFGASCFEPALIDTLFKRPPVERKAALGYGSYDDVLTALRAALTPGPYILGDRFSAADVYLGAELGWAMQTDAPGIKEDALFAAYVARCSERPAFKRAFAADHPQ